MDSYGNLTIKGLRAAMEVFSMQQKPAKTPEEALTKSYQFWNTQPVPKMGKGFKLTCLLHYNKIKFNFRRKD